MKKTLALILSLMLMIAIVVPASAASYVNLSTVKRLAKQVTSNTVWDTELSDGEAVIVNFENGTESMFGVFQISGNKSHIVCYSFIGSSNMYTDAEQEKALMLCNQWNYDYRVPRAYLDTEYNRIVLDDFLYCSADVSDDMIEEFIDTQLTATKQFFTYASEKGFKVFDGLK